MKSQTADKLLKLNYDLYEEQALAWNKTRSNIWEKTVTDFIAKIESQKLILDLGCGNARLYPKLEFLSIKYLGIDPSKNLIKINKQKYPQADFEVGNGLHMKYKNKFNYIFCLAVLHHIPTDKLRLLFLKNIYNALKPKGKIILSVWNRWQPKYINYMFDPKLYEDMEKTDTIVPWRKTNEYRYIHCFTQKELDSLAQKSHFRNIQVFYADKKEITDQNKGLNIYLIAQK